MTWLPTYQEKWCDRLETATTKEEIIDVCMEIDDDDSGGTDLVAMMLANAILRIDQENKKKTEKNRKYLIYPFNL